MKKVLGLSNYSKSETVRRRCSHLPAELPDDKILLKWLKCKGVKENKRFY